MTFTFNHYNFNVKDIDASVAFYKEALKFKELRRNVASDGRFIIVFMGDEAGSPFSLELTYLKEHPQAYDLGEEEAHLAVVTDDYEAAHQKHAEMGCICYENPSMGIYFIQDPDGYWLEIVPKKK